MSQLPILLQSSIDDVFKVRRKPGIEPDRRNRRWIENGCENYARGLATVGQRPGHHLIQHNPKREQISTRVEIFTPYLLGRHVSHGPKSSAGTGEVSFG